MLGHMARYLDDAGEKRLWQLAQKRRNLAIELRYLGLQLALAGLTGWLGLGLAGLAAAVGVLVFYLKVINPKYMGRNLWWRGPKRRKPADQP